MLPLDLPGGVQLTGLPPLSLYVHVPWCVRKCPYCDFNSHELRARITSATPTPGLDAALEGRYVQALLADLDTALPSIWGREVHSVFFGGGTPSLLSALALDALMSGIRARVRLMPQAEVTLEANPGTFEAEKFAAYRALGVNRLSIGVQSFDPARLQALGRIHDAREALRAVEIAHANFDNFNLDLMYALPQQSLAGAGYVHYETSAFAQSGRECRHNLNYWQFGDYLGIGAGAHGKISSAGGVVRQVRWKHPREYMDQALAGRAVQQEHAVAAADLPFEFMMNALRLIGGFHAASFEQRTGLALDVALPALGRAEVLGLVERDAQRVVPTLRGQRFLNDLLQLFLPEAVRA